MATNDDIIDAYRDQLGRDPTPAEIEAAVANITGGTSLTAFEQALNRSLEGQQYDTQAIEAAYRQLFGRTAEDEGQQYWLSQAQSDIESEGQKLLDYLRGGARGTDVTALTTNPQGFTNLQLADLAADPYGGRMPTTSIYDVGPAQGTNISYIDGVPVQFVTNFLGQPVVTQFTSGKPEAFTAGEGAKVLDNAAISAAVNRALKSGAMSQDEYKQLQADLKVAKSMDDVYTAFNKPQATITLDAQYGLQTGQGNTLAEAESRAQDMQRVIDALNTEYMPSNFSVAAKAAEMNVPYAFGPSTYQGYSTMMTPKNVVTDANFRQQLGEVQSGLANLAGADAYTARQFNRAQPVVPLIPTYADRALLGERAPGGVTDLAAIAASQAAPATFGGVASLPARPPVNVSPEGGTAREVVEGIMGADAAQAAPGMKEGGEVPTQGIKSLAQSLPQYGRYNDDMVAHISSDEAALLEALGGAGTINPVTGLPEYGIGSFFQKTVMRPVKKVAKEIVKPVKKVAQELGPVATIAGTYFGGPLGAAVVGGLQSEGKFFDVKRGITTGMMAYGAQQLAGGLEAAGGAEAAAVPPPGTEAIVQPTQLGVAGTDVIGGEVARTGLAEPTMGLADRFTAGVGNLATNVSDAASRGISTLTSPETYSNLGTNIAEKTAAIPDRLTNIGQGIANLADPATRATAMEAFKGSGATMMNTALPLYGGMTMTASLDEMDKMKNEQAAILGERDRRRREAADRAYAAMSATPWRFAAEGGIMDSYDDEKGVDGLAAGGSPIVAKYAEGGQPMFLSGGGDGMSDDIPATIGGRQPARLADGEFVVPADVVSHLGNGSSKAGAKRLYSMMDRVRQARTGTKKQGKEINAMKFLPA